MISLPGIPPKFAKALNLLELLGENAKLMLVSEEGGLPVRFTINPKSVTLSKTNTTEGKRGVIASSFKDALKATGNVKLTLKSAHLTGAIVTQASIDQLIAWATPIQITAAEAMELDSPSAAEELMKAAADRAKSQVKKKVKQVLLPGGGGGNDENAMPAESSTKDTKVDKIMKAPVYYRLPVLLIMWGVGGPLGTGTKVNLEKVDVEYERFDWTGIPVWAKVSLTLVEYTAPLPKQNPTSGGIPGRTKHVVTQGEGLVQIANHAYGSPRAWRAVAEANGLDDPLRIKPGRTLSLPGPGLFGLPDKS
ncbi:LysM peptidoglycan-binding domain-containing protein [Actinokineospora sp.]|uniref:LysM peptidoglycan-binding domain-containing protein n=1 Tax=Actinokineospora sp. TaxID=1872133 RepID=UPI0040382597